MSNIKIGLVQTILHWENPQKNRELLEKEIETLSKETEIVILPEMFSTGFTMNPRACAEEHEGESFHWMKRIAAEKQMVLTGSISTHENGKYYNRLIWMQPDGTCRQYDKNHLFTFAGENKHYTPGKERIVIDYKGWKFLPVICYDLRFPVFLRNHFHQDNGFEYDAIICVANWPAPRSHPWRILLMSRAIENQCYVIGVNRIGEDENGIRYSGDSALIHPVGENLSNLMPNQQKSEVVPMPRCQLDDFRKKFRVAMDWDDFKMG